MAEQEQQELKAVRKPVAPREVVEYWVNDTGERRPRWGRMIEPGDVVVRNEHGAKWEMSAADFDRVYQTGLK